jgi:metal-responsive CopG/Arc/MetJ family transcriptional regulator
MKVETSITVEKDLLEELDRLSGANRSEFIEAAIKAYISKASHGIRDMNDLEIINSSADVLNHEAMDVLDYQVTL